MQQPVTFRDIITSIPKRFRPEKAGTQKLTFHFDISGEEGGAYTVAIFEGSCELNIGLNGEADCVIKAKAEVYTQIELGKTNPQMALMMGKIKVSNLGKMLEFAKLFRKFDPLINNTSTQVALKGLETRKPTKGPLVGIRILDMSRLLPGPLATMMLADMGAEVIKIEDPASPDQVRNFPPFIGETAAYYLAVNRSKRSLAINYNTEEGRQILYRLVKDADVLVEQFRPGVMAKIGLGYEMLKSINPRLVYVSITGYGQTGPWAQEAGHDLNYIARAGLLGITGTASGQPIIPGAQIADIAGGSYMAMNAIMAALLARNHSNQGQHVDVSMMDAVMPLNTFAFARSQADKKPVTPSGHELSGKLANYNVYLCSDNKYVALGALEPKFWQAFCLAVNKPDWAQGLLWEGEKLADMKANVSLLFTTRSQAEWLEISSKYDFCLSAVLGMEELEHQQHIQERDMVVKQQTSEGIDYNALGIPLKFSETPGAIAWPAPVMGADTLAILREAGYKEETIKQWVEAQIVAL
jgi:alpha-methylacyl-CoA racemase